MESIKKILPDLSQQPIPNQKTCKYANPRDDPNYKEPTVDEERVNWLLKYGGITDLTNTFSNFKSPQGFSETLQSFKLMALGQAKWFMMLVYGGVGNGKSKCCEATVIELYDKKNIRAKREKWSDIVRFTLKASFNKKDGLSYEEQFQRLRSKPVLIIDDVGMGSTGGNWEWGELEDIVDYRLEHELFTILTTNLDIKDIPPRIVSRLRDSRRCKLIHNKAPDQRPMEIK